MIVLVDFLFLGLFLWVAIQTKYQTALFLFFELIVSLVVIYPYYWIFDGSYYQFLMQSSLQLLVLGVFLKKGIEVNRFVCYLTVCHVLLCFVMFSIYDMRAKDILNENVMFLNMNVFASIYIFFTAIILTTQSVLTLFVITGKRFVRAGDSYNHVFNYIGGNVNRNQGH